MTRFAQDERHALARLMLDVGSFAPTLCQGWTTHDLAAHLVARERRLDAAPGLMFENASGWTEHVREKYKARYDYEQLVEMVRKGPPLWSPMRIPRVDEVVNHIEFFVHHEDVRRAGSTWAPRDLTGEQEAVLWSGLRRMAPRLVRNARSGVMLEALGVDQLVISDVPETTPLAANEFVAKAGQPEVTVRGLPSELLLFCYGRTGATRVQLRGDATAAELLPKSGLGL
ncbi:MAG: TIGR03085 family protein [Corynebacteriales bacterium]|nr:TIGR03085 family protein [Mycobacteriales bacterium]